MTSHEALETYLDFLETSTSSNTAKVAYGYGYEENHCTPRIDAVLHLYRQKTTKEAGFQPNEKGVGFQDAREPLADVNRQSYESRLIQLEDQLTSLLTRSKGQQVNTCNKLTTSSSKEMCSDSDDSSPSPPKARTKHQVFAAKAEHSNQRRGYKVLRKRGTNRGTVTTNVTSAQDDRRKRSDLLKQSRQQQEKPPTVQVLTLELDAEREGRWKAEQAASRLVEHIKSLQLRVTEVKTQHELAVVCRAQSEEELGRQKETNQTLHQQTQHLEESAHEAQQERAELEQRGEKQVEMLRQLEESYRRLETENMRVCTTLQSRVRDSEARTAGHERELEILRKSLKQSNNQIHQLQELLAKREEDHQKEKEKYQPIDAIKLQDLVASRVEEERNKMEASLSVAKLKLSDQEQAYRALEDEFRMGLRVEASRYNELERDHSEVCGEVEATRQTAVSAVQKERRAVAIVEELTAMVREQKAKIRELVNSKQEIVADLKERLSGLEMGVADRNKIEARMLSLQEDKAKLESQVMAQQSVVEGLREERKLWGQELAHQGASLAQERGTMTVQLDYLTKDCSCLRQQLEKERDAVRVKEKQVEDQVHTIHTLKKTLAKKEAELQDDSAGLVEELQELKFRLEQEEVSNMDLQEWVTALLDRKDELKKDLASKSEERDQWKAKFNEVDKEWEGKVRIIDALEENLQQLQKSFKEKENRLLLEKDKAVQSVRDCEQRLKTCDDAFRGQLEAKEKLYHNNLTKLVAQKDKEVSLADQKVTRVEEEMRELLQEVAKERRNMETKFAQLSTVVQDLQKDFVQV